nr:glycosyltransferase [Phenylobacterium hankyongense]
MIVKNEAPVIRRCLDSVRPIIDYWVIVDTGSTDGTQDIIRAHLAGLPGELHERPWRDFAFNRSEALALARPHAAYSLIIDADDALELKAGFELPELDADALMVDIADGGITYQRMQLVANRLPWRYEGVLHEFLTCEGSAPPGHLDGVVMRRNHDGARRRDPTTYQRDAAVLERALATEPSDFLRARYTFYLAQSYKDFGERSKAVEYYLKRAELGFWDQEIYISLYRAAQLKDELGADKDEVLALYRRAAEVCPWRAEALHGACRLCRLEGRNAEGYEIGKPGLQLSASPGDLFVETWIYDYGLRDEFSVNAYWAEHHQEALDASLAILARPDLPPGDRDRIASNARFSVTRLAERPATRLELAVRGPEIASPAFAPALPAPAVRRSSSGLVSIITPTGGRPEFLQAAMGYFGSQDYSDVEWLILDDSSEPHPALRQAEAPNVSYQHTEGRLTVGEKRNRLIDRARGEYIVQFDDDDFYAPSYVSRMLAALNDQRADLVNLRGWFLYDERSDFFGYWDLQRKQGPHYRCDAGGATLVSLDGTNNGGFADNELGFGFSYAFRKAVWEAAPYPDVDFDEDGQFARQARERFRIDGVYDRTGVALHYLHNRSSSRCFPQYELPKFQAELIFPSLNPRTLRFDPQRDEVASAPGRDKARLSECAKPTAGAKPGPEMHVINLDRSRDRWTSFMARNDHLARVQRFPAVEGALLDRDELVSSGLIRPDCTYSAGTLGCALSHIALWRKAVEAERPLTVFEDDVSVDLGFDERSAALMRELPDDWDLVLWGYLVDRLRLWVDYGTSKAAIEFFGSDLSDHETFQAAAGEPRLVRLVNAFGMVGYSISPKGARALLGECLPLRHRGIHFVQGMDYWDEGIDTAANALYPTLKAYACLPPLVVQDRVGFAVSARLNLEAR